ncbi:hypothetical protein [Marimonas lutisalis]|uniref:hypothetical protein n=1 Tax=Marimonas lutisalis TaxID=2545756 RepID=UPI0010F6E7AA|nr:hypothetical protein [Marimonas lutisalis]
MRVAFLLCLLLAACAARPLTEAEKNFAEQLFGGMANPETIRFHDGAVVDKITYQRQKRPRLACRERIWPEPETETVTVGPAALTIHNRVFYSKPYYTNDYLPDYPEKLYLFAAMLFAHELTHVWQWQNREKTGYSPMKAAREHRWAEDPYLYDINTKNTFFDYAYEQQASIVEEYVCCAALDPQAPRTRRLEQLLKGAFPLKHLHIPDKIYVPWEGTQKSGICQ